jgi:hypothetical protein
MKQTSLHACCFCPNESCVCREDELEIEDLDCLDLLLDDPVLFPPIVANIDCWVDLDLGLVSYILVAEPRVLLRLDVDIRYNYTIKGRDNSEEAYVKSIREKC